MTYTPPSPEITSMAAGVAGALVALVVAGQAGRWMAWASGWRALAARYPDNGADDAPAGMKFPGQCARMGGWVSYRGCLVVTVGSAGLGLRAPYFRRSHPPILIPWSDVRLVMGGAAGDRTIGIELGHSPQVRFTPRNSRILEAAVSRGFLRQLTVR